MKPRTRTFLFAAVGLLIVAGFLAPRVLSPQGASARNGRQAEAQRDQRMQVRIETVQRVDMGDRISMVGTILANEEVEVRSEISGKIQKILFAEGRRVRKGEPLVKINDDDLQAQLQRAQSREAIARQTAERQERLYEKQLISPEAQATALNEHNVARAEVRLIETQIAKTLIRAPFEGSIGLRNVSEGSYISPATLITTLQDNSPVKVDFRVSERYAGLVRPGDEITFHVQGNRQELRGKIYSTDARLDQATRTLRMRALAPNPDGTLIPGALATVDVASQRREAITIPAFALIPDLKGHKVYLARGGTATVQDVEIGLRMEERVEIVRGLQEGDSLITSGILQLKPGMPVVAHVPAADGRRDVPSGRGSVRQAPAGEGQGTAPQQGGDSAR